MSDVLDIPRCGQKSACFGYNSECPYGLGYYSHVERDKCFKAPECFEDWVKSGGRVGLEDHLEEHKKIREILDKRIETTRKLS